MSSSGVKRLNDEAPNYVFHRIAVRSPLICIQKCALKQIQSHVYIIEHKPAGMLWNEVVYVCQRGTWRCCISAASFLQKAICCFLENKIMFKTMIKTIISRCLLVPYFLFSKITDPREGVRVSKVNNPRTKKAQRAFQGRMGDEKLSVLVIVTSVRPLLGSLRRIMQLAASMRYV